MYFCISLSMLAFVSLALLARCSPLVAGLPVCSLLTVSEVSEVLTARSRRAIVAAGLAAVEGATTAAAAREPVVAATWAVWNDQQSSEARCGHTDERDARCSELPPSSHALVWDLQRVPAFFSWHTGTHLSLIPSTDVRECCKRYRIYLARNIFAINNS